MINGLVSLFLVAIGHKTVAARVVRARVAGDVHVQQLAEPAKLVFKVTLVSAKIQISHIQLDALAVNAADVDGRAAALGRARAAV